jgi:hypothetical protein
MRDFLNEMTVERVGCAVGVEALRRHYTRRVGPIKPAEFRQRVIAAGFEVIEVAGGGELILDRAEVQP